MGGKGFSALLLGMTLSCGYTETLYNMRGETGRVFLTKTNAEIIEGAGKDVAYVRTLMGRKNAIGQRLTAYHITKLAQLGLSVEEALAFQDTEKPDAIIAYPYYSATHFIDAGGERKTILEKFKEEYDVFAFIAQNEQEFYNAIAYVPTAKVVVLSGHGSAELVELSKLTAKDERGNPKITRRQEPHLIDRSDVEELRKYFSKLPKDATIYVRGCATAQGAEPHLASIIKDAAGERRVIAAKDYFGDVNEHFLSLDPLEIRITETVDLRGDYVPTASDIDYTYVR